MNNQIPLIDRVVALEALVDELLGKVESLAKHTGLTISPGTQLPPGQAVHAEAAQQAPPAPKTDDGWG